MGTAFEIINDIFTEDEPALFMKAYFDESGKHSQAKVLSIFGLLMSADTCRELQRRWLAETSRSPRIPLPFHMSDCVVGRKNFEYLKLDEDARLAMQERMIRTFKGLDMQAYGASLVRNDYDKIAKKVRHNKAFQDPWFLAFEGGIAAMMKASAEKGKKHTVTFVFDRQDEFRDRAFALYKEILDSSLPYGDRLGGLSFSPMANIAALQAIDVVVYEINRHVEDYIDGRNERWQSSLLREMIDMQAILFNASTLQLLAEEIQRSARGD